VRSVAARDRDARRRSEPDRRRRIEMTLELRAVLRLMAVALIPVMLATPVVAQSPLTAGLDATFAPHAMPKLGGGVEGFNVDMANEIGRRLHRPVNVVAQEFSGLVPGLQSKRFDFLAAPVSVTAERAKSMLFTEGYLNTDYQFVLKKDSPDLTSSSPTRSRPGSCGRFPSARTTWRCAIRSRTSSSA